MAYKGSDYYCDDSIVLRAMKEAKKTGVILMVHAESADLTDSLEKKLIAEGCTEPKYHADARPPVVETESIQRAIMFARVAESLYSSYTWLPAKPWKRCGLRLQPDSRFTEKPARSTSA